MNFTYKSISYAFIANGVQVYLSNESLYEFLAVKLQCYHCAYPWYMNLTECFLCGAINPFLYRCTNCKQYNSITGSSKKCNYCRRDNTLKLMCPNENCISNVNELLSKEINERGGVFSKDSGFLIALNYCLNCGSQHHIYNTKRIYIANITNNILKMEDLHYKNSLKRNSILIIKKKLNGKLFYQILKSNELINKKE